MTPHLVLVGGEGGGSVTLYALDPALCELTRIELPSHSVRGIAFDPGSRIAFALDPIGDRALAFQVDDEMALVRRPELDLALPAGPLHAIFVDGLLITNSLLDHTIHVHRRTLANASLSRWTNERSIVHDGPIWSIDALAHEDTLWIAAGGVEDRPLDRAAGEFGNVDSYLFLYRSIREPGGTLGRLTRVAEWNVSARDVVTPKRVRFDEDANSIWVTGFGSERTLRLPFSRRWSGNRSPPRPDGLSLECPPGITDFVLDPGGRRLLAANPLMDAIVVVDLARDQDTQSPPYRLVELPAPVAVSALGELALGELLVFTTLLTPENRSDGSLSRFTCETCHFEGGVDGRTHFTGREHVFATTKPIRGLGHNVPLFSRSGASSLAEMVPAEFEVANQERSDQHWIAVEDHPWLRSIPELPPKISPELQRRAMLRYLFELKPIPHPARASTWTPIEHAGLRVFQERCSSCHLPLRTTRNEDSRVPFEDWEIWLSTPDSDLVWGAPFLIKTGVTPYVSPAGARVPSLRRLRWKRPYFTNGSARTLEEVLDRFRYDRVMGWHDPPDAGGGPREGVVNRLTVAEQAELLALLRRF